MQNFNLKNVALGALVATVVVFVVWHALGAFTHGVLGVRHMGMMGPGHMAGPMMGQGHMGQGQMGQGQMGQGQMGQGQMGMGGPGPMAHGSMSQGRGRGPMGTVLTGDADRDFAQEMIPHHQMAVDMANDVLKSGKDPELKKLAQEIIAAQQKEIEFLKGWTAKQPK